MDRREAILSRLLTIFQGLPDFVAVYRNRPMNAAEGLRPALFLLDAHEQRDPNSMERIYKTQGITLVRMTPEIFISLGGAPEDVGPQLNALRKEVLGAVFADLSSVDPDSLKSLITENGDVFYDGCATALTMGAGVEGEMGLSLTILYPVLPQEF